MMSGCCFTSNNDVKGTSNELERRKTLGTMASLQPSKVPSPGRGPGLPYMAPRTSRTQIMDTERWRKGKNPMLITIQRLSGLHWGPCHRLDFVNVSTGRQP